MQQHRSASAPRLAAVIAVVAAVIAAASAAEVARDWQTGTTYDFEVEVGDVVTWTWTDSNTHSIIPTGACSDGNDWGDTPFGESQTTKGPGHTYTYTFTREGCFTYVCGIHGSMAGTVTVHPVGETTTVCGGDANYVCDEMIDPCNDFSGSEEACIGEDGCLYNYLLCGGSVNNDYPQCITYTDAEAAASEVLTCETIVGQYMDPVESAEDGDASYGCYHRYACEGYADDAIVGNVCLIPGAGDGEFEGDEVCAGHGSSGGGGGGSSDEAEFDCTEEYGDDFDSCFCDDRCFYVEVYDYANEACLSDVDDEIADASICLNIGTDDNDDELSCEDFLDNTVDYFENDWAADDEDGFPAFPCSLNMTIVCNLGALCYNFESGSSASYTQVEDCLGFPDDLSDYEEVVDAVCDFVADGAHVSATMPPLFVSALMAAVAMLAVLLMA